MQVTKTCQQCSRTKKAKPSDRKQGRKKGPGPGCCSRGEPRQGLCAHPALRATPLTADPREHQPGASCLRNSWNKLANKGEVKDLQSLEKPWSGIKCCFPLHKEALFTLPLSCLYEWKTLLKKFLSNLRLCQNILKSETDINSFMFST